MEKIGERYWMTAEENQVRALHDIGCDCDLCKACISNEKLDGGKVLSSKNTLTRGDMSKCECNEDLYQVCDICQGSGGEDKKSEGFAGIVDHPETKRLQRERNLHLSEIVDNAEFGSIGTVPNHYNNGGEDYIDRTFRTGTEEEIRGAIKFSIGKYVDRLGKKDDEAKELAKIIDYATRYKTHLEKESK